MIVYYLLTFLHVVVCVILILVVLLQSGKGADLAGAFGGGATQTAFGSRGPASFLSKLTTGAAIVFMVTCLGLSLTGSKQQASSVMDRTKAVQTPAKSAPAAKSQTTAPVPTPEQIRREQEEAEAKQRATGAQAQPSPAPATPAASPSTPGKAGGTPPPAPKKP
jgi:preprotein translocase subunit SecG